MRFVKKSTEERTIKLPQIPKLKLDWIIKRILKILYFAFILAGIASAVVSALIEFDVFAELFQKSSLNRFNSLIPALIVFTFETSKVYLIYMNKSFKITTNEHYLTDKRHFLTLRFALISISVLATLIFSFFNLHNPEYDKNISQTSNTYEIQREAKKVEVNALYDQQLSVLVEPIDEEIRNLDGRMTTEEGYKFTGRQEYRGPRYNEAKKLKNEAENRKRDIVSRITEEKITALNKVDADFETMLDNAEEKFTAFHESGNKMLSATLQIINLKTNFPQWQYLIIITFISIMLSIGLEYIIWAAFTTLAIDHTKKLNGNNDSVPKIS